MKRYLGFLLLTIVMGCFVSVTTAQQLDTTNLKVNVDILSGVLRDGLGVNETPGLFGLNVARVDSVYVRGQGVIMDIQTPLARRRNRVNINALASSISRLPTRSNPFEALREPNPPGTISSIALSLQQGSAGTMYRTIIEEIQSIDVTTMIDSSIRQASTSARSLRELGELDQDSFNNLQQELYSMREDLGSMRENLMRRIDELRQMENSPLQTSTITAATPVESELRANLDDLKVAVEQLKNDAESKAASLSEQYESAKAQYQIQWRIDVSNLEDRLYTLLCDYGATLRDLPDNEYLTIVFSDLGEETETDARTDKIHILSKVEMAQCQSGSITAAELLQRSLNYSY